MSNLAMSLGIALAPLALPQPSFIVEIGAGIVVVLLATSSVGLARGSSWADNFTRAAAIALLVFGTVAGTVLSAGIAFHRAVGGKGTAPGPLLLAAGLLLVLPYAVVYPLALLAWVKSAGASGAD